MTNTFGSETPTDDLYKKLLNDTVNAEAERVRWSLLPMVLSKLQNKLQASCGV